MVVPLLLSFAVAILQKHGYAIGISLLKAMGLSWLSQQALQKLGGVKPRVPSRKRKKTKRKSRSRR